jgi:hypothetical protein
MFIDSLPDPAEWLTQFWDYIQLADVDGLIQKLAIALFLVAIIWSGIKIATLGTGTQDYMGFFLRVLTAGYLIFAADAVGLTTRVAWIEAETWGYKTFAATAVTRAQKEMGNLAATTAVAAGTAVAVGGLFTGATEAAAVGWAGRLAAAGSGALETGAAVTQAANAMLWMAIPIVLVYYVIILGTGFSILIASIILPLSGALMMFPSTIGADFMGKWLKGVVAAIFSAAFVPLIFATALEVGFVGPAKQYNKSLETNLKSWSEATTQVSSSFNFSSNPTQIAENLKNLTFGIGKVLGTMFSFVGSFIISILMLLIGVAAGVMVMNTLANQISTYVGGSLSASGSGAIGAAGFVLAQGLSGAAKGLKGGNAKTGAPTGPGAADAKPASPKGPGSPDGPKASNGTYNAATGKYTGSDRAAYDKAWSEARKDAGSTSGNYGKGSSMGSKTTDPPAEIRSASSKPDTFRGNSSKKAPKIG